MTLPDVPDTFRWSAESWGAALRCRPLESIAPHLFTTRRLPVAGVEDAAPLLDAIGGSAVVMPLQVHGRDVVVVRGAEQMPAGRPTADVVVSTSRETAIAVRSADCVPLLMADARTGAVAALHAGWRGTAARASAAAVEALGKVFDSKPEDLVVAIGPCIGVCCYEVGSELVDAFAAAGHERHLISRWFQSPPPGPRYRRIGEWSPLHLDLAGANRDQLVLAGVPEERIHISGLCTAMHLDVLTSFRAEKERSTRLAAVIRAEGARSL